MPEEQSGAPEGKEERQALGAGGGRPTPFLSLSEQGLRARAVGKVEYPYGAG